MATKKNNTPATRSNPPAPAAVDEKLQKSMEKAGAFEDRLQQFSSADEALHALSEMFGGVPFADAAKLSLEGTSFEVTAAIFEPGLGFKGQDRWNVSIVTQFGEPFALTLTNNPQRAGFMTSLAKIVALFGKSGVCKLQAIDASEGVFYAIVPAAKWKAPTEYGVATIDGIIQDRQRAALRG